MPVIYNIDKYLDKKILYVGHISVPGYIVMSHFPNLGEYVFSAFGQSYRYQPNEETAIAIFNNIKLKSNK